jgi:lysophospholipase L1-like esterase
MSKRTIFKEGLLRLVLVLASLSLALGALEIAARVVRASRGGGKEESEGDRYIEHDPLLGWRKRPGAHVTYRRSEYTAEVAINSKGMRGPERGYRKPPEIQRILAIGDSFVEAYSISEEQTFVRRLESSIRKRGYQVEVLNGGTRGYATDQEYLFYLTEGARYTPAIVILFFYYNDVVYNDRQFYFGMRKPIFEIGAGRLQLHRYPVPPPPPVERSQSDEEGRGGEKDAGGSALVEWIKERLWYGAPSIYDALGRVGLWEPMSRISPRWELRVYQRLHVPEIEDAWIKTTLLLDAFDRSVRSRGARFLVAGIPSIMEVDDGSWTLSRQLYGLDDRAWDRGLVMRRLTAIGAARGFPVLDLTPALKRANRWFRKAYYPHDGHLNARGHRVVADEVGRFLADCGWLRDLRSATPVFVDDFEVEMAQPPSKSLSRIMSAKSGD